MQKSVPVFFDKVKSKEENTRNFFEFQAGISVNFTQMSIAK
jgi:hypothetical protein